MDCIVKQEYPYGLNKYTKTTIIELGLEFIETIQTEEIEYGTDAMKVFLKRINEKCRGKHLWILFGSNDKEEWIPFQVASKKSNIISEIRTDFLCMTSFDEKRDKKIWSSFYHKSVMEIEYGHDTKCQK